MFYFCGKQNQISCSGISGIEPHDSGIFYGAKTILRAWFFNAAGKRISVEELYRLAKGNLENIHAQGCINSLTGPVERGDKNTVQKHMDALDADMKNAYLENAKQLLEIAEQKNPDRDYAAMREILMPTEIGE